MMRATAAVKMPGEVEATTLSSVGWRVALSWAANLVGPKATDLEHPKPLTPNPYDP